MRRASALVLLLGSLALGGCRQDMHDQPRLEPYETSSFFADGRAARPRLAGTLARGELIEDELLTTGRVDGELADLFPFAVTPEVLARGRERYGIYCTPCHGADGGGEGMIVRRGMRRPASFHAERLLEAPAGHFFDVMTRGFGVMYDYSDRIAPADRWAIAAWVRVLQRAGAASLADVPDEALRELETR